MTPVRQIVPYLGGTRTRLLSTSRNSSRPRTRSNNIAQTETGGRRSARTVSRLGDIPSLKDFVQKTAVIRQYRGFLRAVALIPDETFRETAGEEVKKTFRQHSFITDKIAIDMEVKEGARRLEQVRSMVGYVDPSSKDDPDSWLNIHDEEDQRGRVGIQWPWDDAKS